MDSDTESVLSNCRDPEKVQVACLYGIDDLQKKCQSSKVKLSEETNRYMLYLTLRKLGPYTAQKLIKKLVERGEFAWDNDEDFEVEAILDHGLDDRDNDMYLVKWKDWGHQHNTWEPKQNLAGCEELLKEFHVKNGTITNKKDLRKHFAQQVQQKVKKVPSSGRSQIQDIFVRISESNPTLSPLELLSLQSPAKKKPLSRKFRPKRLVKQPKTGVINKRSNAYKVLKAEQKIALKRWEDQLNAANTDPARIFVENVVDIEGPPDNFIFITDYKEGPGITIPQDPIVGCECENCYDEKKSCCAANAGSEFAYYKTGKVRVPPGTPIYECNKRCACGPSCENRVVQLGRKHRVCIFRTSNNRGWGVKAMQTIKKGSFIMEYVGEVISNEEAERRGKEYDAECRTYLFDLDYNDGDCPFTVDAGLYGNVSHFVNHSCDPNMSVYGVWINTLDPRLPRIALFANKDIQKGQELTFDYMMTGDTTQSMMPTAGLISLKTENDVAVMETDSAEEMFPHNTELTTDTIQNLTPKISHSLDNETSDNLPQLHNDTSSNADSSELDNASAMEVSAREESLHTSQLIAKSPFFKRKVTSPSPAMKYRITCQCGAANCRKYLF